MNVDEIIKVSRAGNAPSTCENVRCRAASDCAGGANRGPAMSRVSPSEKRCTDLKSSNAWTHPYSINKMCTLGRHLVVVRRRTQPLGQY